MANRKLNFFPTCTSRAYKIMQMVQANDPQPAPNIQLMQETTPDVNHAEVVQSFHEDVPELNMDMSLAPIINVDDILIQADKFLDFVDVSVLENSDIGLTIENGEEPAENDVQTERRGMPIGDDVPSQFAIKDALSCGEIVLDAEGNTSRVNGAIDEEYVPGSESSDTDFEEMEEIRGQLPVEVPIENFNEEQAENEAVQAQSRGEPLGDREQGIKDKEQQSVIRASNKKRQRMGCVFKESKNLRITEQRKRETGMAYHGIKKNKEQGEKWDYKVNRPSKQLKPSCNCKMSLAGKALKCRQILENERKRMHTNFWKNMTWPEKRTLISSLVDVHKPKYLQNRKEADKSRRIQTLKYHLKHGDARVPVCKIQFLNTFDVKYDFIYNCIEQYRVAEEEEVETMKISSKARHQEPEIRAKVDAMVSFLKALPRMESHYCRQNTNKLYLQPIFQAKRDVYRFYETEVGKQQAVSFTKFDEEYNRQRLSIYTPRKDQCDTCVSYRAGNCSLENYEAHQNRKTLARKEKEEDNKGTHFVATLDMQGVLLSPTGFKASSLYYKMKLCVHNFTIFNNKTHHVVCYVWHEAEGGITSNEFATLYVNYIRRIATTLMKDQDVILWSDGAGYQNRNQNLSNALLKLSSELNINIIQKYLEVGHTQMECDSIHAHIERKLKNRVIYTPADYVDVMRNARINPTPYEVEYLDHKTFMNYSKLGPMCSIRPGRTIGDPKVNDLRAIKYVPAGQIFYKLNFDEDWSLLEKRQKKNQFEGVVHRLYKSPLKIKEDKFRHLQELKSVIPKDYHYFYNNLSH